MSTHTAADRVRIACVQWPMRGVRDADAFFARLAERVRIAADYGVDFVLLPELFTCELLSAHQPPLPVAQAVAALHQHTERLRTELATLARAHRVNIVGGSHLCLDAAGVARNVCYVALRDGSVHAREKIHVTPNEHAAWRIVGGQSAAAIQTDCGTIGVAICYDAEFPELCRHLVAQGAELLFVPFCTDDRHGYLRVRYSCHARAIENQCYVALAGAAGTLAGVPNLDVHYSISAVLTPCDLPFARDGIAAEATANVDTVVVAELDMAALREARRNGTVRNLADRRTDLYPDDPFAR
jgi:predicted amidohydrolase